jgi:BolA family transcriptional regulator, general stress-responsive regulator
MNTPEIPRPHVGATLVEQALRDALTPTALSVQDDSAAHAGHAGAREGSHFSVSITSERFRGLTRVARHRLVYDCLLPYMQSGIHALALTAKAPDED